VSVVSSTEVTVVDPVGGTADDGVLDDGVEAGADVALVLPTVGGVDGAVGVVAPDVDVDDVALDPVVSTTVVSVGRSSLRNRPPLRA
jgi:hypothetical protein